MKQMIYTLSLLLFSGLCFGLQPSFEKGSILPPKPPLVHTTEGFETDTVRFEFQMSGQLNKILSKRCLSCVEEAFNVNSESSFYVGEKELSRDELVFWNQKAGTVVYFPESKNIHAIHFFNLED